MKLIFGLILSFIILAANAFTGAGATFPAPLYSKWADAYYKETGVQVNYQSIGSGAGIKQIIARTVQFGATDAPLKDEELQKNNLLQFPTVIGGVVPVVNIPGIMSGELKLTGGILADIYLGKIKVWNDKSITSLNPKVKLPALPIMVVHRADGSGTSFLFTNYLSKVNTEWKTKVGEGTAVNWTIGVGGKGNEGVSTYVQRLLGSIGYVEYVYAKQNNLTLVQMKNAVGNFVLPEEKTFKAAAEGADWNKSFYQILTNKEEHDAWPITGVTYILYYKEQKEDVIKFFDYGFKHDIITTSMNFVPLPNEVKELIHNYWKK